MLLFYHCFCDKQRLDGYDISFFPFTLDQVVLVSSTFKTCVSIFALVLLLITYVLSLIVDYLKKLIKYDTFIELLSTNTISLVKKY